MKELFECFNLSDIKMNQEVADEITRRNSSDGNQFLIDQLSSIDPLIRNTVALAIHDSGNIVFKEPLLKRIKQLGTKEEIGTLVFGLESFDCSDILVDIIKLHVNGNPEIKMGTSTILSEQKFLINEQEKEIINQELKKDDWTLDELEIEYSIKKDPL